MPNTREIIDAVRAAAVEKGDFADPGRDQELHARMRTAFHAIEAMDEPGKAAFRQRLCDVSPHVRSWVAAELLSRGDPEARRTLEKLAAQPGLVGLTAATILKKHDAGRLRSLFE